MQVVHTRISRPELRRMIAMLPYILSGRIEDRHGFAHGFRMRLAVAFFSKVKQAYIVKARGGTDEAGYSWPKLSAAYLAYQRPIGGSGGKSPPKAGGKSPGGKDGFMSADQLNQWRRIFAAMYGKLKATEGDAEAKAHASAIAWSKMKKAGVKTKLEAFGAREVEILRDTGRGFNSLSPGVLSEIGASATYSPEDGQVVEEHRGELIVGTNVKYMGAHHSPKNNKRPTRRLWPEADRIPDRWWSDFRKQASGGFAAIVNIIARGGL